MTTVGDGVARLEWPERPADRGRCRPPWSTALDDARAGSRRWVDPDDHRRPAGRDLVGAAPRGRDARRRPIDGGPGDRIVYARLADDLPAQRAGGVPGAAQLVPAAQARDQPDAGPRPRRPGAAVPADLQAGLGPARRRGRGRRVPAARGRARGRGGARARDPGRAAAAHRLAAAVERLGRRALPGLRRRRARRRRSSTTWSARSARSATRRSARSRRSRERCADFTARRVESALANLAGGAPAYTESGLG